MVRLLRGVLIGRVWTYALLPVLVLVLFLALVDLLGSGLRPHPDVAAVEQIAIEGVRVTERGISAKVRAESPEAVTIAQLQIDGAFWLFAQEPPGALSRAESAWIHAEFPWIAGDTHHLRVITGTGVTAEHSIDIAALSPVPGRQLALRYGLLGVFVGLVPVALGMLFFPLVKSLQPTGREFVLALTIGLLAYLWVDMTLEGLTFAGRASSIFGGAALIWIPMALTFVTLAAVGTGSKRLSAGTRVAVLVAAGIGLHNFGEGLVIGSALASNEIALGTFLIVGFALHNVSEGLGIVSPLPRRHTSWALLAGLALLAGVPAVPGIWIGAFLVAPHWAAIFFGVGAGAVLQVVVEIDRFLNAEVRTAGGSRFSSASVAGYSLGTAIMYATALLVAT